MAGLAGGTEMAARAQFFACLALMAPLACSSVPVARSTADRTALEARARAFVMALSAGEASATGLDETLSAALPKLVKGWEQMSSRLGGFKEIRSSSHRTSGDRVTIILVGVFSVAVFDIAVSFNAANKIEGLRLRLEGDPVTSRPQTPKPPFPYAAIEVVLPNPADDSKIAGTLTIPKHPGPHPAAILITGSGSQDRDSTIFGHKPFWVLADHLSRRGVAVLRLDDRGVGGSTGSPTAATIQTHATDISAAATYLLGREEIDSRRIGLIGHSEGAIIAPIVASDSDQIAFVILLAGPGLPGKAINLDQVASALPPETAENAAARKALLTAQTTIIDAIIRGDNEAALKRLLVAALETEAALATPAQRAALTPAAKGAKLSAQLRMLQIPWFRSFLVTDPAIALRSLKVPVLALNGAKDTQVSSAPNLGAIKAALTVAANPDFETRSLAGLNHLFQRAETGEVGEYATITETINNVALLAISDWLAARGFAASN